MNYHLLSSMTAQTSYIRPLLSNTLTINLWNLRNCGNVITVIADVSNKTYSKTKDFWASYKEQQPTISYLEAQQRLTLSTATTNKHLQIGIR